MPQTSDSLASAQRRVHVTIEYRIEAANAPAFIQAMDAVRRLRRRDGALRWELLQDTESSEQFTETFVVESWAEHLRQHERVTMSDRAVEEGPRHRKSGIGW
jgi:quinol monooxygenase YgiN